MLKTLVCDDEVPALELMSGMLRKTGLVSIVAACQSAEKALSMINQGGIDLAFFDVEMPALTGVEAVRLISADPKPLIVFATAHAEYAVDAFGIDAIDYILKPFDQDRVLKSVEKAVRLNQYIQTERSAPQAVPTVRVAKDTSQALKVADAGRFYVIPHERIVWVEAAGDYSIIHKDDSEVAVRRTISSLEDELPSELFCRVHRSTIISINRITEVRRLSKGEAQIQLTGDTIVKASRSYRDVVTGLIDRGGQLIRPARERSN